MITFDYETKSYADLQKVGTWEYSRHPTTEVICACYKIDEEPIREWWPSMPNREGSHAGDKMPEDLYTALLTGHTIEAHHVAFERSIWMNVSAPRYGWAVPYDHSWRDSMATACYYAMPAGLDPLCRAIGTEGKDPEGARLITKYSKLYLKTAKTTIPDDDFRKFVNYCKWDVAKEREVSDFLGDLPERELAVWQLDQEINLRGLYLDAEGIAAATRIVEQRSETLVAEFREMTGFNPTQRDKVLGWFHENGLELENMQAAYLQELLEDGEIPSGDTRRALEIRTAVNKASTKKLDAMDRYRDSKGRARFQVRYHGASTGRWTGGGIQPYNLNRGFEDVEPEQLVRDIMYEDAPYLDMLYGDAIDAVAKASRHWIMAPEGKEIIAGDYVSIEAILLACLAGEQWKVDAFARGEKIYELMGDKIHGLAPGTVTKSTHPTERQDGKIGELAFGYQGALGAWLGFDNSGRHSDERIIEICKAWRKEHPATTELWKEIDWAAIKAVNTGKRTEYRQVGFEVVDAWLSMILPDGKRIWYFSPRLAMRWPQWHHPLTNDKCRTGKCHCEKRVQLSYMTWKNKQWRPTYTYGGKLTENLVQATSRQILVPAMHRVTNAGYPIVLTVYDEIVSEVPKGYGSDEEFVSLMEECPGEWAEGWPVDVKVWRGQRYKK